jgi:lysyl endopeptidase
MLPGEPSACEVLMIRFLLLLLTLLAGALPALAADHLVLPAVDKAAVARDDAARERLGEPFRFALPAEVAVDPAGSAAWEDLPGGLCRWQLVVECPGSTSLNLGFSRFRLPWGGRLEVGGHVFTAADNAAHGQLWTQIVPGDALTVTLTLPADRRDDVDLELTSVGRGYRGLRAEKSGSCNIDVVCPEGDDWRAEIRSVGVYTVNGTWMCTGAMVNNTAQDATPLFLTAQHCNVTPTSAPSVVVYWNFESPVCGQHGGGSLDDFQTGAVWRASYSTSDFTLVELEEAPDPAFGVTYAGWDASGAVPTSAVTIHHPSTDEKSISFENDPLSITGYLSDAPGNESHLRIADWDLGTTEPGSSGSPLFDPAHHVVGQLHGGYAACNNDLPDWYGRFAVSWTGGGVPTSRLQDWLDPAGLGVATLDLLDPALAGLTVTPVTEMAAAGNAGGPFAPANWTYTLGNDGDVAFDFEVTSAAAWLAATPASGTLAPGATTDVVIAIAPAAASLPAGTFQATVSFAGAGAEITRQATLQVAPVALALHHFAPNPALNSGTLRFDLPGDGPATLAFYDLRGRRVREIPVAGGVGENAVTWDGRDDDGARVPSGVYVCRLSTPWGTLRTALTLMN